MRLLTLVALATFSILPASAQIGFDLNLGPTVAWTGDPDFGISDEGAIADGRFETPVTVGLQGGLGVTLRNGPLGVRVGGRFLNTTALYDGEQALNRQTLETSFVTLQLDLQYVRSLGPVSAYVFGGPEARYLVDLSGDIARVSDLRDGADLLSAAANIGAGLRLDLFGIRLGPEVRYALDLTGVGGGNDVIVDEGGTLRFDDFDVDTLLIGIVFGGP